MTQNASLKAVPVDWVSLLNEQADEWYVLNDLRVWFAAVMERTVEPDESAVLHFWDTLNLIRAVVYDLHFGRTPDWNQINERLQTVRFSFADADQGKLPRFRAWAINDDESSDGRLNDSVILRSLAATVLADFAQDISRRFSENGNLDIARCEGLYRDPKVNRLSAAPNVAEEEELQWRREVEVLVERGLERSVDILRCADIFVSANRSRFCSNGCRTNTFQIVKQLMEPDYLADKQRRYREKKK